MPNHATLSANPARLLVADDDQLTLRFLADNFAADGYTVATAGSAGAARIVLEREPVDLIVIDVNGNTLPLLDALRAGDLHHVGAQTPVLVLTGHGEEQHRVRMLERGADDLVLKPFSYPELRLRVAAVLRRQDAAAITATTSARSRSTARRSAWVAGRPVRLSRTDFSLLAVLRADPTQTFTRAELVAELWGPNGIVTSRALDSHAHRLRRRLRDAGAGPGFVQNVWGVGLRLTDPSTH